MCFADWSRPDLLNLFIGFGTFLTAGFTLGLIIVANKGFKTLAPQEALKYQLDIVTQLVNDLSSVEIAYSLIHPVGSGKKTEIFKMNVFKIATEEESEPAKNYEALLFEKEYQDSLAVAFRHIGNPLLPNEIASYLNYLKNIGTNAVNLPESWGTKNYYTIGVHDPLRWLAQQKSVYFVIGDMNAFIGTCRRLTNEIIKWYKSKEINDLNNVALLHEWRVIVQEGSLSIEEPDKPHRF